MITFNHTIVRAQDPDSSACFIAEILGLPEPFVARPFVVVSLENGATLDYMAVTPVLPQHYAFRVNDEEFDAVFERIQGRALRFWAGPGHHGEGRVNRRDGGRGVYFDDPDGHAMEVITRPYADHVAS